MKVDVTPELVEKIQTAIADTGTPLATLLRGRKDKPPGYTSQKMYNAFAGHTQTISKEFVDYTLKICAEAPKRIDVAEFIKRVLDEQTRTGVSYGRVLKANPIKGLSLPVLNGVMHNGTQSIEESLAEAFLRTYETYPDTRNPSEKVREKQGYISHRITPTKAVSLTLPEEAVETSIKRAEEDGFVDRAEYLRFLVRMDHLKPKARKNIQNLAKAYSRAGKNKGATYAFSQIMWDWITEISEKLSIEPAAYLFVLIMCDGDKCQ